MRHPITKWLEVVATAILGDWILIKIVRLMPNVSIIIQCIDYCLTFLLFYL